MGEILSQGVLIDFCTACKGAWLDQGEARFFSADPEKVERALAGELRNPHPSKLKCPRCAGAMTEGGVFTDDYLLDRCNDCQGVWFDGRELSRLRDAKLVGLDPVASRSSRPRGAMAGATAGMSSSQPMNPAAYMGGGSQDAISASIDAAASADGGAPAFNPAALAAAVPAIPNLALRSVGVFGGLGFILGGIFIAASLAAGLHPAAAVLGTLFVIALQYAIGPFILDFSLRWMNGLRWMTRAEIPPHVTRFLDEACKRHGVKFPHIGIIEDGSPNAFTYGHTPNNARIVITRGILDLLNEDEADAVIAHELGHVVHWDAVVMTLAGCVPILCYGIYRACVRAARGSRKNGQYAWAVALVAYVLYIVAEYLVLMLSRTREYYADRFSAEATGNPNALASALVKVAYGLVSNENAIAQGQQQQGRMAAGGGGMRAFGIFDPSAARNLAAASYAGGSFSRDNLVGAMQWDLWNPWAKWFELHSTHPLPANRLQALAGEALKRGQLPLIVFDKTQPESYWDEFAVDVFIKLLPAVLALIIAAAALVILGPAAMLGGAIMGYGVGKLCSTMFMYHTDPEHEGYPPASTAALLKVVKVSPVRGVPARLKGKVIGRGNAGHILSEDVVIQDKTGILFLDYRTIFAPMSWWFALSRVPQIMGQEVEARGWYRRGPAPYFELREIRWAGGSKTSWIYPAKLVWGGFCVLGGGFLTIAGFLSVL